MTASVLFYVQHLLGIGHLIRAGRISRALSEAGFAVTFVSGGTPVPGFDVHPATFVQLPPIRAADQAFSALVDEHDRPIDDAWRTARRERLLDLYTARQPDIVLLEMFPFGRRQMRFELDPLLAAAHADQRRPLIAVSLRDILVPPRRPDRVDETLERVKRFIDLVLVHGDPTVVSLAETFPRLEAIAEKLRYTGYVIEPGPPRTADSMGEVLVSAGGGAVAEPLIDVTLAARPLCTLADQPWRVITGPNLAAARLAAYRDAAPGVAIEHNRADFRQLLANSRLSISQGGYNTVVELLAAETPALCIPFAADNESEQTLRCARLAARGWLHICEPADLTPQTLAAAIDRAAIAPQVRPALDLDGARHTGRLLAAALAQHS